MTKKNVFITIAISLTLFSCRQIVVKDIAVPEDQALTTSKKIALVGFYPYTSKKAGRQKVSQQERLLNVPWASKNADVYKITYQINIDYNTPLKKLMNIGNDIRDIPYQGIDTSVSQEKISEFKKSYLSDFYEQTEMSNLFITENNKLYLKSRDVDYYAIGIFNPQMEGKAGGEIINSKACLGQFFYIISLGIIPNISPYAWNSHSIFLLYDRQLNLIKKFEFDYKYYKKYGWFVKNNTATDIKRGYSPPAMVWEPHVEKFNTDLIDFLNNVNK